MALTYYFESAYVARTLAKCKKNDLDAVSMAHNPLSGHSCVLVTLSSSYISRHGQIQLCVGINAGIKAYLRYGYQQAAND